MSITLQSVTSEAPLSVATPVAAVVNPVAAVTVANKPRRHPMASVKEKLNSIIPFVAAKSGKAADSWQCHASKFINFMNTEAHQAIQSRIEAFINAHKKQLTEDIFVQVQDEEDNSLQEILNDSFFMNTEVFKAEQSTETVNRRKIVKRSTEHRLVKGPAPLKGYTINFGPKVIENFPLGEIYQASVSLHENEEFEKYMLPHLVLDMFFDIFKLGIKRENSLLNEQEILAIKANSDELKRTFVGVDLPQEDKLSNIGSEVQSLAKNFLENKDLAKLTESLPMDTIKNLISGLGM